MTVSCKNSLSDYRLKNRLRLETTLQDFEKRQLLPKVNNTVDSLVRCDYNWDIRGKAFRQEINPKLPIWVAPQTHTNTRSEGNRKSTYKQLPRLPPVFLWGAVPVIKNTNYPNLQTFPDARVISNTSYIKYQNFFRYKISRRGFSNISANSIWVSLVGCRE